MAHVQAFVHYGDWNETTRNHPATKMMEIITNRFDEFNKINPQWFAEKASFQNADGSEHHGLEKVLTAVEKAYQPLTSHFHEPQSIMCIKTDDGYKMLGQAKLFGNLPGTPAPGESKVRDKQDREWDIVIPAAWFNWYVEDEKADKELGMVIKRSESTADGSIPLRVMLKRKLISVEEL